MKIFMSAFKTSRSLFYALRALLGCSGWSKNLIDVKQINRRKPNRRLITCIHRTSLVVQMVKCLPTIQETRVRSLGQEDPLEKEMETHSSTLVWKIPWMEEPGRLQSMGLQRVGQDWETSLTIHRRDPGELSNSPNGWNPHLKYHLQGKTRKDVGDSKIHMWGKSRKIRVYLLPWVYQNCN